MPTSSRDEEVDGLGVEAVPPDPIELVVGRTTMSTPSGGAGQAKGSVTSTVTLIAVEDVLVAG
jgi:hypothetical protein